MLKNVCNPIFPRPCIGHNELRLCAGITVALQSPFLPIQKRLGGVGIDDAKKENNTQQKLRCEYFESNFPVMFNPIRRQFRLTDRILHHTTHVAGGTARTAHSAQGGNLTIHLFQN